MLRVETNVKAARQILQQQLAIHHSYRVTSYRRAAAAVATVAMAKYHRK